MGGTIGYDPNDTWKPYTNSERKKHAKMVQNFEQSMKDNVSEKTQHDKKLQFMADNGIRQLGPPRIGVFLTSKDRNLFIARLIHGSKYSTLFIKNLCNERCLISLSKC